MNLFDVAPHGIISTAQARSLGIDARGLHRLERRGEILRLVRGWYAVRPPAGPAPWLGGDRFETATRLHRLRTLALLASFGGRAVASHQSALVLHEIDTWRADLGTVHLARTADDHSRHRRLAVLHPSVGATTQSPEGHATVPVSVAVVQVGLRTGQDGTSIPEESLVAADCALRRGRTSRAEIDAAVEAARNHPGIRAVAALLAHADGRHESVGETRLALAMRLLGFRFRPQVEHIIDGRVYRTDFDLEDVPVSVEFDGFAKYGRGASDPTPARLRAALAAEKRREDALRREGRVVVRFIWAELDSVGLIARRLGAAVATARRGLTA